MGKRYVGVLEDFFETGCEGVIWVLAVDGKDKELMYGGLAIIEGGDHLRVMEPDGSVLFDGIIHEDRAQGWAPYPRNPKHGQPCALGYRIHWTQYGWKADDWARLFIRRTDESPYRAELIKAAAPAPKPIRPFRRARKHK